jgi:hypothetical protein
VIFVTSLLEVRLVCFGLVWLIWWSLIWWSLVEFGGVWCDFREKEKEKVEVNVNVKG